MSLPSVCPSRDLLGLSDGGHLGTPKFLLLKIQATFPFQGPYLLCIQGRCPRKKRPPRPLSHILSTSCHQFLHHSWTQVAWEAPGMLAEMETEPGEARVADASAPSQDSTSMILAYWFA